MKTKIIATIMALGMVATVMAAVPVSAASYQGWWFADLNDGSVLRIVDNGAVSANGALTRWWKSSEPTYHIQGFGTAGGTPWVGMSDWVGPSGAAGDHAAYMQTYGGAGPTDVTAGNPCYFIMEEDANVVSTPRVYYSTVDGPAALGFTVKGTVPNGYLWAGLMNALAIGDEEVFPGTAPATTFFKMYQMPAPVEAAGSWTWSFPAHEANVVGDTAAQIQSWNLLQSTANSGPWTVVGTANYGSAITYAAVAGDYYCVRIIWDGGINSAVLSQPVLYNPGPSNTAPVVASRGTTPSIHNGNIASELVTIYANITDVDAANTLTAEYRVDGGAWVAFAQTGVSPLACNAVYNFPNGFAVGAHTVEVRAYDGTINSAVVNANFQVVDTTAPVLVTNSVPGTTIYATAPAFFSIGQGDFTAYNALVANSYFRYRVNNGTWNTFAWTNQSFAWGSYTNILTYTIPAGTFAVGNWVDYSGQVRDTAATPNTATWAGGSFQVTAAPPGVQDDFVVYGRLYLYDGDTGVYSPILSAGGGTVTATWFSTFTNAIDTRTDTVNALGQFSIDILNYTDGANVMLTATFDAPYNNAGTNYTVINAAVGSIEQNVLCGVPYNVEITAPLPLSNQQAGIAFPATYTFYDRAGLLCQGYYSFADGPMLWTSGDLAFVPPAARNFNGVLTGGTATDALTLFTPGAQWINISETTCDWYPTPWNNFNVMTGFDAVGNPLYAAGWLKDFDNITVNVLSGGFDWEVVDGWNLISVPQDPVFKGTSGTFDAWDAINLYILVQIPTATDIAIAARTGPSTYNICDLTSVEAGAFAMDSVHGYWVFSDVAGIVHVNALNYSAGLNTVNTVVGWNLLGFTHNFVAWTNTPDAVEFTNGVVTAGLNVPALSKIVVTEWREDIAPQWYHSYVVTPTFPGMATHNWAWDMGYSTQPGNGYFLWTSAAVAITFNVNQ